MAGIHLRQGKLIFAHLARDIHLSLESWQISPITPSSYRGGISNDSIKAPKPQQSVIAQNNSHT